MRSVNCIECNADNLVFFPDKPFKCAVCGCENGLPDLDDVISDRDNAIRRGDELYDQLCTANEEIDELVAANDSLADRLRDRDVRIENLLKQVEQLSSGEFYAGRNRDN